MRTNCRIATGAGLRRVLAVVALCFAGLGADAAELVANGSFEINGGPGSQSFTGWTVAKQSGSSGGFFAQTGVVAPLVSFVVPPPPVGTFAAMSDQTGPGTQILYQDIAIPGGNNVTLSMRLFVQNQAVDFYAPGTLDYTTIPNQQVRVDIMNPGAPLLDTGAGVLRNLFVTPTGSQQIRGYFVIASDLSAFAGQTVRIRIAEVDNQQGLNVGVDTVSTRPLFDLTPILELLLLD